MTYNSLYSNKISFADSNNIDAFGRLRVSNPKTLFSGKNIASDNTLQWTESITNGTSTFIANNASVDITVNNDNNTATTIRQTKRSFNYQAGKSMQILITYVLGAKGTNITKRVGYFNANNGIFLEQTGTALNIVQRTYTSGSVVETRIAQSSWNIDDMTGSGTNNPSNITYDDTKANILFIDFEWLGVGRVRMGFVIDGVLYNIHEFRNANALTTVYMSTPNLPIRYEITTPGTTDGTNNVLRCICSSVNSEGGIDRSGISRSLNTGIASVTATDSEKTPVMAIRLKSTHLHATLNLQTLDLFLDQIKDIEWGIQLNPTILNYPAGTPATLTFTSIPNSSVEGMIFTGASMDYNFTTGEVIESGYTNEKKNRYDLSLISFPFGAAVDGTSDIFVVYVRTINSNETVRVFASLMGNDEF